MTKERVMVVYAVNKNPDILDVPWIYGVYEDEDEGYEQMVGMQESKDYGHLRWSNNLLPLVKNKI